MPTGHAENFDQQHRLLFSPTPMGSVPEENVPIHVPVVCQSVPTGLCEFRASDHARFVSSRHMGYGLPVAVPVAYPVTTPLLFHNDTLVGHHHTLSFQQYFQHMALQQSIGGHSATYTGSPPSTDEDWESIRQSSFSTNASVICASRPSTPADSSAAIRHVDLGGGCTLSTHAPPPGHSQLFMVGRDGATSVNWALLLEVAEAINCIPVPASAMICHGITVSRQAVALQLFCTAPRISHT